MGARGFSTVEVMTVLSALAMLSGMAAPAVQDYVTEAKLVKVCSDVRVIATSLTRLANDVGPESRRPGGWATYLLLVGAGGVPRVGPDTDEVWALPINDPQVASLDSHLVTNTAAYGPYDMSTGFGWHGAYLENATGSDPWGSRYAVNARAATSLIFDTIVLSAGPNGVVETPFERDGISAGGDDVLALVSSGGF